MKDFCEDIKNKVVYPVLIKNKGRSYLALYYYTERSDSILHGYSRNLLCFRSTEEMEHFCRDNALTLDADITEYDFDMPISNPIDFDRVLNNWNLLNTIAAVFGMYFEGDAKKYNALYDLLFRLNTPALPIPPTYDVGETYLKYILKVFRKKDRFLGRFELYRG